MKRIVCMTITLILMITMLPVTFASDAGNFQTGYIKSVSPDDYCLTIIDSNGYETEYSLASEAEINGEIYYDVEAYLAIRPGTYASFYAEYYRITILNFSDDFPEGQQISATLKGIEYDNRTVTASVNFNYIKKDCLVTMAMYNIDGTLLNVASKTATTADTECSVNISALPDCIGLPVKVFFWDNTSSLKPVHQPIEGDVAFSKGSLQYGYVYDLALEEQNSYHVVKMHILTNDGLKTKTLERPQISHANGTFEQLDIPNWQTDEVEENFARLEALLKGNVLKFSYNPYDKVTKIVCAGFRDDFCDSTTPGYTPATFKYNAASRKFNGYGYLTEDASVYLLDYDAGKYEKIWKIVPVSELVDEGWYTIHKTYKDYDDSDNNIIVLESCFNLSYTVVSGINETQNEDGETIWNIDYYIDGDEISKLTTTEVAQGKMPTVGDVVRIIDTSDTVTSLKFIWDFTENIRTASGHMDTITPGDYLPASGEIFDGGIAVAYKSSSSQISFADNNDADNEVQTYKLSNANKYIITTARDVTISPDGSYKYLSTLYKGVSSSDTFRLKKNNSIIADAATAEEAKALTDYVLLREYNGRVTHYFIIRGIDSATKN